MAKKILYVCINCKKKFEKLISDDTIINGAGGVCPHCSAQDGSPDVFDSLKCKFIN